jgi:hypothetical protein
MMDDCVEFFEKLPDGSTVRKGIIGINGVAVEMPMHARLRVMPSHRDAETGVFLGMTSIQAVVEIDARQVLSQADSDSAWEAARISCREADEALVRLGQLAWGGKE